MSPRSWLFLLSQIVFGCTLAFAVASCGHAATLLGRVVGVKDGDTLIVLCADGSQNKVRLAGIDAPERGQAFSDVSKRRLSALSLNKLVVVDWHKRDRYGRRIGVVRLEGSGEDVGFVLVQEGMAWHYKSYASEQPPADRKQYAGAETHARTTQLGLWLETNPVPPWEYRQAQRDRYRDRSLEGPKKGKH